MTTDLAAIAAQHRNVEGLEVCRLCRRRWPCDTARLLALLTPENVARALAAHQYHEDELRCSCGQPLAASPLVFRRHLAAALIAALGGVK